MVSVRKRSYAPEVGKYVLGLPYTRERFLARLNDPVLRRPSKNLSRALDIIAQLNLIAVKQPSASAEDTVVDKLERELNSRLERYRTSLQFSFRQGTLLKRWVFIGRASAATDLMVIVPLIVEAHDAGHLGKLARCQYSKCGRWFVKRKHTQSFCPRPAVCYHRALASTPKFKAERAAYMKQYRADEKKRNERAKRKAKQRGRKS